MVPYCIETVIVFCLCSSVVVLLPVSMVMLIHCLMAVGQLSLLGS